MNRTEGIEPMTRSTTQRIAILGLAAVALTTIGGTASGAGDEATTTFQTWHPGVVVSGRYQHTLNPDNAIDGRYQHTLNPAGPIEGRYQHTFNPDAIEGRYQHTWNPVDAIEGRYQHTWNLAGECSDACPSSIGSTP